MTTYDMQQLKEYVTGGAPRQLSATTTLLDVTHNNIRQTFKEIPFEVTSSIASIKDKIYTLCGTKPEYMRLTLKTPGQPNIVMEEDSRTLAQYGCYAGHNGQYLYVEDLDPFALSRNGGLDDVSQVQKYVMSDEDYAKRENTYRAFKQKMIAQDPNWKPVWAAKKSTDGSSSSTEETEAPEATLERVKVGMRCEVQPGGRRGVVSYVGPIPELTPNPVRLDQKDGQEVPVFTVWIGITLDEPVGKHDGVIHGKRYFQAPTKCGSFVKPSAVMVGDFPEVDPFADSDDDMDAKKSTEDIYEEL